MKKMNKRAEDNKYFYMNKRADIAVVILVLGVLALMIFALLSFYLSGEKSKEGGINSVFYLQEVYNIAESVRFSDESLAYKYGVGEEEGKYVLDKVIKKEKGLWEKTKNILGVDSEDAEVLKIKYKFGK